ncbi:uncharacterized protein BXZ73DRAFT_103103 [Epithele typhae]|uniref:uncharacterized protein n=1 Tax=Epithele typhae TaxID=378194 RepID=UPI00200892B1|nr:uncharacterized protein BXZ73DRAFT_103103 [Epithele typhae]KAH9925937.1 hypothetical protein BXZ73DRAFT_103103 [Epithele typhae]
MPLFAVYAPDYTDEDAINRRLAVRETHLARSKANPGRKLGGAMVTPNDALDKPDQPREMVGSLMVWECTNYAEALERLHGDPYWINNVWDKEKTLITPFVSPVPM